MQVQEIDVVLSEEDIALIRRGGAVEKEEPIWAGSAFARVRVFGRGLDPPGPVINRDVLEAVRKAKGEIGYATPRQIAERALEIYEADHPSENPALVAMRRQKFLEIAESYARTP